MSSSYSGYKPKLPRILAVLVILVLAGTGLAMFGVFGTSGEVFPQVPPGFVGIMISKTGRPLPPGAVVAPAVRPGEEPYQGIQQDVLMPGWYLTGYNPYDWDWSYAPLTQIPPDHVGVLTRLFGEPLPDWQLFADENPADGASGIVRKGILRKTLEPGTHPINTLAYDVLIVPKLQIDSGQLGVRTLRYGKLPTDAKALLSETGSRGVQKEPLAPGSYYMNPFAESISPVSRQSHRLDLGIGGKLSFPSSDGFEIFVTGTVEWSLQDEFVPLVFVKYGTSEETETKLLLPATRAKSRLQGSRKPAREFITGTTRQTFQDEFARDLRQVVEPEGVHVHSVLISGIEPPHDIAQPIREREISLLEREQYEKQKDAERSRAALVSQSEIQKRPEALAKASARNVETITEAKREQEVDLIVAQNQVDVAALEREAAVKQAEAIRATGLAEAEVTRVRLTAQAEALKAKVAAYGGGTAFARTTLFEKLAPRIDSILSSTDGPIASVFEQFVKEGPASRPAEKEEQR
ncbi:MAG: hypothetical protein JNJ88_13245 [Planctomycetes bacterium]|nr:hypothetical protein [Planctomycetota bacterium]